MLLEAGASPTVTDDKGNTLLHRCESAELMAALLKAGGDLRAKNKVGSPLFASSYRRA